MTAPPSDTKEGRLDRLHGVLLEACNTLSTQRTRALRARERFLRAQGAEPKARTKRDLERALGDLRAATFEFEAARTNLRRELGGPARLALDEVLSRLERHQDHYEEVSKVYGEALAAYEASKSRYHADRAALGLKFKIPGKFDGLLTQLEEAGVARDKAFAESQRAHRRSLAALERAIDADDEYAKKPTPSNKIRRHDARAGAHEAFEAAGRATSEMARALAAWFEAEKQFALACGALEATRGTQQIVRLEVRAQEMLREAMKLNWASLITDEALSRMVQTIGELKSLN